MLRPDWAAFGRVGFGREWACVHSARVARDGLQKEGAAMKFVLSVTVFVALVGVSFVACGGDDDDDTGAAGASGAGAGGVGGSSGVGGHTGGTGGSTMMMTGVPCGATTCMSALPMLPGVMLPAGLFPAPCCLNSGASMCGVSMNGGACMMRPPPPTADPTCPGARMGMAGCCINGDCGQDASLLGMGCVENGAAAAATMGLFPIPPPRKCGLPPDTMTEDGGTPPPAMSGADAGI
jgi:hypothetical protein